MLSEGLNINDQTRSRTPDEPRAHLARQVGSLFLASRFGVGKWHFGKADLVFDSDSGIERFRTTIFFVLFLFPLIPTGTFIIKKRRGFFSKGITVLEKLPLDYLQVLKVWAVSICALWALIWVLRRI